MRKYITYIWLFVFFVLTQQLKGQNIQVDSLIVTPPNPTKNDISAIRLYTYTAFKAKKISTFYSLQDGNVNIIICYNLSALAIPSYFADTFILGKLTEGKYYVNYMGYFSADTTTCNVRLDSTEYNDSFIVKPPNNIYTDKVSALNIYPNPVHDKLNMSVPKSLNIIQLQIRDIQGHVWLQCDNNNVSAQLNVSALPAGVYLLYVDTDKDRYISKVLKE